MSCGSIDFSDPWLDKILKDPENKAEFNKVLGRPVLEEGYFAYNRDTKKLKWVAGVPPEIEIPVLQMPLFVGRTFRHIKAWAKWWGLLEMWAFIRRLVKSSFNK